MTNTDTPHLEPELDDAHRMLSLAKFASRREELGLTLSDIFLRTRISVKNLAALERGDFASLPNHVYTSDFIRQYAKLLDINPRQALQEYGNYLKNIGNQVVVTENSAPEPEVDTSQGIGIASPNKSSRMLFLFVILLIVLGGCLVFLLESNTTLTQRSRDAKDQQAVKSPPLPREEENVMVATEPAKISPDGAVAASGDNAAITPVLPPTEGEILQKALVEAMSAITISGPMKLMVKARETTWIGIRIDDQRKEQETTLYAGGTATYTGNRFWLNIGNAGGTDVFLEGKLLPSFGKKGEAVRIVLPPKNQ